MYIEWLQSIFHFSFADYYNPNNMNFGVLRVVNDDLVKSNTGFEMHPIGNKNTITRGHVQYMSAGTGISHTEYNYGDITSRFLQIWLIPDEKGLTPNYGDYRFEWANRRQFSN